MGRRITARVVLNVTVFVSDNARDDQGPLSDDDAVLIAIDAMLMNDEIGLNPDDSEDLETFGRIGWNEPSVLEVETTSVAQDDYPS